MIVIGVPNIHYIPLPGRINRSFRKEDAEAGSSTSRDVTEWYRMVKGCQGKMRTAQKSGSDMKGKENHQKTNKHWKHILCKWMKNHEPPTLWSCSCHMLNWFNCYLCPSCSLRLISTPCFSKGCMCTSMHLMICQLLWHASTAPRWIIFWKLD